MYMYIYMYVFAYALYIYVYIYIHSKNEVWKTCSRKVIFRHSGVPGDLDTMDAAQEMPKMHRDGNDEAGEDMEIPGDSLDMSCSFHQAWDDFHLQGETLHS